MMFRLGIAAAAILAAALGLGGCVAAGGEEIVPAPVADCVGCAPPSPAGVLFGDYTWYGGFWPSGDAYGWWPHHTHRGVWHGSVHASRGFHVHRHG